MTGQPWAWLILTVLLICVGLARMDAPHRPVARSRPAKPAPAPPPRPAKALQAGAPAPVVRDVAADMRQLKRRWRQEDHRAWDEDFNRLLAAADGPATPGPVT